MRMKALRLRLRTTGLDVLNEVFDNVSHPVTKEIDDIVDDWTLDNVQNVVRHHIRDEVEDRAKIE